MSETKRLGRGLEALLGPVTREHAEASGQLRELPVGSVKPNPYQPRTRMDEGQLDDLVASMQASGLLQPVVVRPRDGGYELIAGERRWRAASRLGWAKIPAVVKDVDDQTLLTLALIENLQRDDLSPIDEAAGYQRLGAEFSLPHGEIARLVGRNRATVTNLLRLLQLPNEVQSLVHERKLAEGHARALLGLTEPESMIRFARQAVDEGRHPGLGGRHDGQAVAVAGRLELLVDIGVCRVELDAGGHECLNGHRRHRATRSTP